MDIYIEERGGGGSYSDMSERRGDSLKQGMGVMLRKRGGGVSYTERVEGSYT